MAAYENVTDWTCRHCVGEADGTRFLAQVDLPHSSVRCYVAVSDRLRTLILAFTGSNLDNLRTFLTDLDIRASPWPPEAPAAWVHAGFLASTLDGAPSILVALRMHTAAYPDYEIAITGHSLGAAQAVLFTTYLVAREPTWAARLQVYTYGEPRVGNVAFAQYYTSLRVLTHRAVNRGDVVPHVPFQAWGFHHHGVEVWIRQGDGQVVVCPGTEHTACSMSLPATQWSVLDHFNYWGAVSYSRPNNFAWNIPVEQPGVVQTIRLPHNNGGTWPSTTLTH
ncbi:hypothetical protein IWQ60_007776 [Tieghemiomyces parasiticus]|uniref:Fungal lipase-type domain-containing protein n=1 Tax=Tieghemiomyces parasiticus TaxID=78921 RepID=A0A9W8A0S3_9FUNG|nr:hypothetical protein IWQ60_007776 [Tieghemiomyces parasiticus]